MNFRRLFYLSPFVLLFTSFQVKPIYQISQKNAVFINCISQWKDNRPFDKVVFQSFKILKAEIENLPSNYKKILFSFYDVDLQNSSDKMEVKGFPAKKDGEFIASQISITMLNDAFDYPGAGRYSNFELKKKQIKDLTSGAHGLPSYQYILFTPFRKPQDDGIYYLAVAVDETTRAAKSFVFEKYGNKINVTEFTYSDFRAELNPSPPAKPCYSDCE